MRKNDRQADELRPVSFELGFMPHAEGSCLISFGNTKVLCAASIEVGGPRWMGPESESGWVTAEYAMLPRSTHTRSRRKNAESGRSKEISRLIGRSLRAVCDMDALGPYTVIVDCDVLQADGGTRTAAVTGGFAALVMALRKHHEATPFKENPIRDYCAAISVGLVEDTVLLDLNYDEDSQAQVDMNLVGCSKENLIEVQMTSEDRPITSEAFVDLMNIGQRGIVTLVARQRELLGELHELFPGMEQD